MFESEIARVGVNTVSALAFGLMGYFKKVDKNKNGKLELEEFEFKELGKTIFVSIVAGAVMGFYGMEPNLAIDYVAGNVGAIYFFDRLWDVLGTVFTK